MPRREDDDVAPRSGASSTRTVTLAAGFALAAGATLAVFLTDDAQYLRVAVVAVAWAFVLATFAAGRRSTDRAVARAREQDLRRAYELELEREVAARHEYELELENELRRETEDSVRSELDALRGDIAALSGLRDEVARVSDLRGDLAALTDLRDEVARVAALRDDVAALNSLRQELGQLADLRADMGRLRAELTEQLSSEMLVERIVMRTQASRLPADQVRLDGPGRTLDGASSWTGDVPPRELTGGWPAVRLDEPREHPQVQQVRVERVGPRPPVPSPTQQPRPWDTTAPDSPWDPPSTSSFAAAPPRVFTPPPVRDEPLPPPPVRSAVARHEVGSTASRHAAQEPPAAPTSTFPMAPPARDGGTPPAVPPPSPMEWLAARSLVDAPVPPPVPEVPPRRRRRDDDLAAAATTQRPAVPTAKPVVRIDDRGGYRVAVREEPAVEPAPRAEPTTQGNRLAQILAENGVSPATGGRRRRRYRDDDESDDVLARVLRGN
jgi:hypothetical protein